MHLKMKQVILVNVIFLFLLYGYCNCNAGIIFQDDFESDSSNWTCGDGNLSKWTSVWVSCGYTEGFGYEWKMGSGHNSSNAVYAWKCDQVPNGYRSGSDKWLSGNDLVKEIYHRWYMKVPPTFDKSIPQGFKFWRYILREYGYSNPPVIYLNAHGGNKFSNSDLSIYNVTTGYLNLVPISSFNDDNWHCHELRIKLNSDGQSDGIIQYWLDGELKATYTNLSFSGSVTSLKIHMFGVGIGNVSDPPWDMSEWTACIFDDVVVADQYIGPIQEGSGHSRHYYSGQANFR